MLGAALEQDALEAARRAALMQRLSFLLDAASAARLELWEGRLSFQDAERLALDVAVAGVEITRLKESLAHADAASPQPSGRP